MALPLLNCDMGESFGNWRLGLDAQYGVRIAAYRRYTDLMRFGRRPWPALPAKSRT